MTTYQPPTTAEIECSCFFSALAGFLWLLPPPTAIVLPPQPLKLSARAYFGRLWAFSDCHHHNNPSTTPYNHRNRALVLVFGGCGLSLATTTTTHQPSPTTAEIERSCSFPAVVGLLWLPPPPPTMAEIEHSCSFSAVVGLLWPLSLPTAIILPHNHRNRALMLIFGGYGLLWLPLPRQPI